MSFLIFCTELSINICINQAKNTTCANPRVLNITRNFFLYWPNLYQAIDNRDVNGIVENIHRKDIDQKRNDWAESMAKSIRFK